MRTHRCSDHKTSEEKEREDKRGIEEKRKYFQKGDIVVATDEYKRVVLKTPAFEGGEIVDFKDPWTWAGTKETSCAYVKMSCGCVEYINVGWLKKER